MNPIKRLRTHFTSKVIAALLVVLTVAGISTLPSLNTSAHAQIITMDTTKARPLFAAKTADDSDVTLLVKYIGPNASGLVAVSAAGAITFTSGALGGEIADTTLECPVSGALGGVIDVSNAACDTVGEVVNIINGSGSWYAVPVDSLFTDDLNCGGTGCLKLLGAASASGVAGLNLVNETAVNKNGTTALIPKEGYRPEFYLNGRVAKSPNPWGGYRTWVTAAQSSSAFTTASSVNFYQVLGNYRVLTGTAAGVGASAPGTETVDVIYGPLTTAATTVNKVYIAPSDPFRVFTDGDRKLVMRTTSTGTVSAMLNNLNGFRTTYPF